LLSQHKKDPSSQDTWIGQLIEAQAQTTGKQKKTLWKQLGSRECIQLTACQVKFVLGKMNAHCPLAIVSEPMDNDGCWECTTNQGLEWACLAEAGQRFMQANQTPCFKPPLWEIFGKLGVHCCSFDAVLEGMFVPPEDCDLYAKKLLYQLRKLPEVLEVGLTTIMEYIMGWQHAREETSSLYSMVHFGHYMAGTYDDNIALFNAHMAWIPTATGYSPNWW